MSRRLRPFAGCEYATETAPCGVGVEDEDDADGLASVFSESRGRRDREGGLVEDAGSGEEEEEGILIHIKGH